MKIRYLSESYGGGLLLLLVLLAGISCKRIPTPEFDYVPFENPEVGDTIRFINVSVNADSYNWDFGDGHNSRRFDPEHIYEEAGIFDVQLIAFNDAGDDVLTKTLTINEATELGFLTYDQADSSILTQTEVWIYDNLIDWEEIDEPLRIGITDPDGTVYFRNVEPDKFHIYAIKQSEGGFWFFSGSTPDAIMQNQINLYTVPCTWIDDSDISNQSMESFLKKSSSSGVIRAVKSPGVPRQ